MRVGAATARFDCRHSGFSLVEALVAMAIMAMSLGVLYQVASGAVRNVREAERHSYAVVLATSLLALHETVPKGGFESEGVEDLGGDRFRWRIAAVSDEPQRESGREGDRGWPIYRTEVRVGWSSGTGEREFRLTTINLERPVPIVAHR